MVILTKMSVTSINAQYNEICLYVCTFLNTYIYVVFFFRLIAKDVRNYIRVLKKYIGMYVV
jgi:hypothetical protein